MIADEQAEIEESSSNPISIMGILESVRVEYPEYNAMDDEELWVLIKEAISHYY